MSGEQAAKLCVQYLAPIVKNRQYNFPPLGEDFFVGAEARPNEVTYSEPWMRPDYVPPAPDSALPAEAAGTGAPPPSGPPPGSPLPAEAASADEPGAPTVATDPAAGLPGLMVPSGGVS
jgi:phospholipid/cholesterol/gamma-HCH transport system substrate-binding protein